MMNRSSKWTWHSSPFGRQRFGGSAVVQLSAVKTIEVPAQGELTNQFRLETGTTNVQRIDCD